MQKNILIGTIVVLAVLVGIGIALNSGVSSTPTEIMNTYGDHVRGDRDAGIELIEYADFQCPACAAYYPVLKELESRFGDRVRFVYRHFPLTQIHANALAAARASEAAALQGKFFEMHDLLYERQSDWAEKISTKALFTEYAQELRLQKDQFVRDLASPQAIEKPELDARSARLKGVNATPTFFLNGNKLNNPTSLEEFISIFEEALRDTSVDASTTPPTTQ